MFSLFGGNGFPEEGRVSGDSYELTALKHMSKKCKFLIYTGTAFSQKCPFLLGDLILFVSPPHQYGPFHIPEDALVGTTVTAMLARDADVRGGDSWQVDYCLESGNEEEVFSLVADKQTNEVSLVLSKVNNTKQTEALHTFI